MKNGYILIDKDKDKTSFSVVNDLRKIFKTKKIGHTGTLDPMATGLLLFGIGKGTKAMSVLSSKKKEYIAVLTLGISTDTEDITGNIIEKCDYTIDRDKIYEVFNSFLGSYLQTPPMYSAKKVKGQKLYDLARKGITIDRKPEKVTIYDIKILDITNNKIRFIVSCSKGTYIRTLCKDIGARLNILSTMSELRRTKTDDFSIEDAITLDDLVKMSDENRDEKILPLDYVFKKYNKCITKKEKDKYLKNGNELYIDDFILYNDGDIIRVYLSDGEFCALYQKEKNVFKPLKMFL